MAPRVPASTYRLQLGGGFGFREARAILPYLDALGVACVYTSPYLRAQRGSAHGYDVVDWSSVDPSLGTFDDYRAFTDELHARGMTHLADIVPNHVGIGTGENAWWWDVLESGPSSLHADAFDVEWAPPRPTLADRVLLPVLGRQLGVALEAGEIQVRRADGWLELRYFDKRFPVAPRSTIPLLERALASMPDAGDDAVELASIATALRHLPTPHERAHEPRVERAREKEVAKRRLGALLARSKRAEDALDRALAELNGTPGEPRSFDALEVMLDAQSYRLAFWRVASEEINYRRFFDINDLAAVRMEEDAVFEAAHAFVFGLVDEGRIDGLRIDHTDGLYDPAAYLRRVSRRAEPGARRPYVVVEKILERGESLPDDWEADGTTGYDALAAFSGVLVDARAERAMTALYERATGDRASWADHVHDAKRLVLRASFASEVNMLAQSLARIAEADRRSRDFTLRGLTHALVETIACFPVYRTYIHPDGERSASDERIVERAIRRARRRSEQSGEVFDFLRDVLLARAADAPTARPAFGQRGPHLAPGQRERTLRLAMRVQQVTGPVTAKGVEDTAFYRYARFVALNEVGGAPDRFGTSVAELHALNAARRATRPYGMTATSTHDTKRGEDVRARLAVLSELPDAWAQRVDAWRALAQEHATALDDGARAPSDVDVYLFFQTVIGALPLAPHAAPEALAERVSAYLRKAAKEAKSRTSWLNPDDAYDAALDAFARGMLSDARFTDDVRALGAMTAPHAASNALAQVVLKLCSPGVPDTYQGCEGYDLSLVDPDNRRPVDFAALARALADDAPLEELAARYWDGAVKQRVTRAILRARRDDPLLFLEGSYEPLEPSAMREHVVAFARRHEGRIAVALAARLPWRATGGAPRMPVGDAWGDAAIALAPGAYVERVSGARIEAGPLLSLRDALRVVPVALLVREAR